MKSAAIYLFEKKGKTKEQICEQFRITKSELAAWLLDRESIKIEVKNELTRHYISAMTF
jgi:transcriptional regulator with XRE-family HTH domain